VINSALIDENSSLVKLSITILDTIFSENLKPLLDVFNEL
jgi:hypothetical protein